jgi:hypothetical protein
MGKGLHKSGCRLWPAPEAFPVVVAAVVVVLELLPMSFRLARATSESIISEIYQSHALPPLWEVVYQEGIRGNHFLFAQNDLRAFEDALCGQAIIGEGFGTRGVEELVIPILESANLQEIRKILSTLTFEQKLDLFVLYKRALEFWGFHLKTVLN